MTKKLLLIGSGAIFVVAMAIIASVAITNASTGPLVGNATSAAMPVCPVFSRSLSIGKSGSDVTALQAYLNEEGYLSVTPTGYFGSLTQSAVARWQARGGVAALGGVGSGIFGPLSRAYFLPLCNRIGNPSNGSGNGSTTQGTLSFTGNPQSGIAPLTVQFKVSAPQGTTVGNSVNFGDGTSGTLGFAPVCSSCNLLAVVSHTYTAPGTYTASLINGACACPANGVCNCPNLAILATTNVTVVTLLDRSNTSSTTSGIQQLNTPGNVALTVGGIAEIRNANFYFTLTEIAGSNATINITPVGCWNSFPSDPTPGIRCMLAVIPTPPQTLSVGQMYKFGNYNITLTNITSGTATFSVQ